jgi:hypothetical protein
MSFPSTSGGARFRKGLIQWSHHMVPRRRRVRLVASVGRGSLAGQGSPAEPANFGIYDGVARFAARAAFRSAGQVRSGA